MLTFSSKATGNIQMLDAHGRALLAVIGREPGLRGVITPEQMPEVLATLEAAIAAERVRLTAPLPGDQAPKDPGEEDVPVAVNMGQRAFPLMEMLKRAHAANVPVLWNV